MRDATDRTHALAVGDSWLTAPAATTEPPGPGPVSYRITAADCCAELNARRRHGVHYFDEPLEADEEYNRQRIGTDIGDDLAGLLNDLRKHEEARRDLGRDDVGHLDIKVSDVICRSKSGKTLDPLAEDTDFTPGSSATSWQRTTRR